MSCGDHARFLRLWLCLCQQLWHQMWVGSRAVVCWKIDKKIKGTNNTQTNQEIVHQNKTGYSGRKNSRNYNILILNGKKLFNVQDLTWFPIVLVGGILFTMLLNPWEMATSSIISHSWIIFVKCQGKNKLHHHLTPYHNYD